MRSNRAKQPIKRHTEQVNKCIVIGSVYKRVSVDFFMSSNHIVLCQAKELPTNKDQLNSEHSNYSEENVSTIKTFTKI